MASRSRRLLLAAFAAAGCATVPPMAPYHASGYEPGWTLDIADGRIVYVGDYGSVRVAARAAPPQPIANGYRYRVDEGGHRLLVEVVHAVCYGASGAGFADTVRVVADGRQVDGCGGTSVAGRSGTRP